MGEGFCNSKGTKLLLFVAATELIDTSCCIKEGRFSGVERVRFIGNLKLVQRILIAIFPFNGFFGFYGRTGQEGIIA